MAKLYPIPNFPQNLFAPPAGSRGFQNCFVFELPWSGVNFQA
jgi:hypothetical protein